MAKLKYVAESGIWTVRGDGGSLAHPITPDQALQIDEFQFLDIVAEAETLDELSRLTLASYVGKAHTEYGMHNRMSAFHASNKQPAKAEGELKKASKRNKGISKALGRLAQEEVETILQSLPEEYADELAIALFEGPGGIVNQLQAASDITTTAPVRFTDGHTTTMPLHSAQHALAMYQAKKDPRGKRALAQSFGASLASFHGTLQKEGYDPLEEISKEKTQEYLDKAEADKKEARLSGDQPREFKRIFGTHAAKRKLNKEETEMADDKDLNELSKGTLRRYIDKAGTKFNHDAADPNTSREKLQKKDSSIARAVRKVDEEDVTKEEFDAIIAMVNEGQTLDEISKGKLARYIGVASINKSGHAEKIGHVNGIAATVGTDSEDRAERDASNKQHGKRSLGIQHAAHKLAGSDGYGYKPKRPATNEEAEVIDETGMVPVKTWRALAAKGKTDPKKAQDDMAKVAIGLATEPKMGSTATAAVAVKEDALAEKQRFDDDSDEVAEKLANKDLKKAYTRMKKNRANEKRRFEDTLYAPQISEDVASFSQFSDTFAASLKKIVEQKRSIDEEAKIKDFLSRTSINEAFGHEFHNYLTTHASHDKIGETKTESKTIHHYAHPDSAHEDGTGHSDKVDVHVSNKTGKAHAVATYAGNYGHSRAFPEGSRHNDVSSLHTERERYS